MVNKPVILIVEDEQIVAQDIGLTLENLGYIAPRTEASGEDAILAANELKPDLILMDIMLQGKMTGIQAAEIITSRQSIPIIYLTAFADQKTLASAKLTQPFGYILKPFEEQELQTTIEMALYKHKMERALVEKEKWLSITLQSIGDAVITTDESGAVTFINDAAIQLADFSKKDARGMPIENVIKLIRNETDQLFSPIADTLSEKEQSGYSAEGICLSQSGERIPVTCKASLISDETGKTTGAVLTLRDNTDQWLAKEALKRSEEHYRNLVEHTPIAIIIHINNQVVFINQAAISMFGAKNREELLDRDIHEFIDASFHPKVEARLYKMKADPSQVPTIKERFLRLDGSTFDTEVSAVPFQYEGKDAIFVVAHDITERTRLEEELRQSHKLEAIGRLAGGIAHDFNNLLTAIIGYSDLGLSHLQEVDPLFSEMEQIKKAASRAADLTKQLLAFSRRQILQPKVINLNTIITEMEKLLDRVIGENIDLSAQYADELHLIMADAGQLQQVIMNLVINARDAMPNGGRLEIATQNISLHTPGVQEIEPETPGDYVRLSVRDTGTGISEETLTQIFEPFFTTKQPGEGTGLGLSTVYGIVKQSGGDIRVNSTIKKGTEFIIYFPKTNTAAATTNEKDKIEKHKPGSETILLVEDEEMVRSLASTILTQSGYRVHDAVNGTEAIRLLDHLDEPVDLLLTDLIMPGINGSELKNRVVKRYPEIKTIYMSGYTEKGPSGDAQLDPDIPFLQKPFTLNELVRKVRDVLDEKTE